MDRPAHPRPSPANQAQASSSRRHARSSQDRQLQLARHLSGYTQPLSPLRPSSNAAEMMEQVDGDSQWRTWPELTVGLRDVSPYIETWDIYQAFSKYGGKIIFIDIQENSGGRGITARVRFNPVPRKSFWEHGTITLQPKNREAQKVFINIEPPRRKHDGKVQSPVQPRVWYRAVTKLFPTSIEFGVMSDEKTMLSMKSITSPISNEEDERVKLNIDLIRKKVDVFFGLQVEGKAIECYKFHLEFSTLKKTYWHNIGGNRWAVVIPTVYPPAYFWKRGDVEGTFSASRLAWDSRDLWCRATDILANTDGVFETPLSLPNEPNDPGFVNIGRWTTFRFILEDEGDLGEVLRALGDFNIKTESPKELRTEAFEGPSFWSLLDVQSNRNLETNAKASSLLADTTYTNQRILEFDARYQLEVCISKGIFCEYRLGPEFLTKLLGLGNTPAKQLLEHLADRGKPVIDPMSVFDTEDAHMDDTIATGPMVYNDRVMTRKVLVTPAAIYLTSPTPEIANRILRKYRDLQDRFLRVQFTGELLEGRINSRADTDRDDGVFKRVYRVLDQGIRIGDRHFEFLAFGNSQMRENGAYFFAPTDHLSCDNIRKDMGSFRHIRSVAKHAARMGQCFSTTREVRAVNVPNILPIPDIENEEGYCFTDGVGKISNLLADLAANEMGLGFQTKPSAYQFRMGGCKGVLTVWSDAKKSEVHIRKSQEKFVSQYNGLEIIRCAQFASATLNRQTITILHSLGVKNEAFTDLLDKFLEDHEKAELNSQDAIRLLRQHVDENQTTLTLAKILLHGFNEPDVQEPFVLSILSLWRVWSLKLIKERARIPLEKSAFVLGCADETGTLRGHSKATEGSNIKDVSKLPQIFLQVSSLEDPHNSTVITGVCMVGRNPSLHPGDIRVVEAVDIPALRHLRNVVVFPTRGDRDVPSMLSGGDLDGDDFFVIWDPTLLPPEWNHPPMEHLPVKPKVLNRDVQTRDLCAFFVKYMKNDILPTVALAHLAHADFFDDGAKNQKCLALAQLHSKAVDYVKSGEPAEIEKSLRPRRWPTFMEKHVPKEATYRSTKPLGIIYDKVHRVAFDPTYTKSFDKRILEKCLKDKDLLRMARQIKTQYDTALRRIMGQREIATEFEIWSGFVLSKPRVGSGYKLQEEIGREYGSIKLAFRALCQEAAGGPSAAHIDPFVAAMYKVTEEEVNIALHERRSAMNIGGTIIEPRKMDARSMPLISFPWIFHEVLCRLATGSGVERFGETEPQAGTHTVRKSSTGGVDGTQVTHLNDGRIVHRGEVLNLFDPTEDDDDEVSNVVDSEGVTQSGDTVHASEDKLETRSEAGSSSAEGSAKWVPPAFKIRLTQRAQGQPDIQLRMMDRIQKDLAEMKMVKHVERVNREASVVPVPEMTPRTGHVAESKVPSEVPGSNDVKIGVASKQVDDKGKDEVAKKDDPGRLAGEHQAGGSTSKESEAVGLKEDRQGEPGKQGKQGVAMEDLPSISAREANDGIAAGVGGSVVGWKVDGKGEDADEKENRSNHWPGGKIKSTGENVDSGSSSRVDLTPIPTPAGGAIETRVRAELAAAKLLKRELHRAEDVKSKTGTARPENKPNVLPGVGSRKVTDDAGKKTAAGQCKVVAGVNHKGKAVTTAVKPPTPTVQSKAASLGKARGQQRQENIIEEKEHNAVDLLLGL